MAERVLRELPVLAEWVPVHVGADRDPDWDDVRARARAAGALPLAVPPRWPPDTLRAMRAATFAKGLGKTVAFCLAAFRQAYAGGRDLGADDTLVIAGAAAEMHPRALLRALDLAGTRSQLDARTREARTLGVERVPALVLLDGSVHAGPDCLEAAAAALA